MSVNMEAGTPVDLVRIEVLRNKLTSIANEMSSALQRTAYSTNIKTRLDFSCALFDASKRAIAQSFSQPVHLGSLVHFVPRIIDGYGAERLEPGDGLLCNDGFRGGVHLNDVCLVAPVFHEDRLVAYVAAIAHHLDVGGATPGSLVGLSKDVFAEGLRLPPTRLLRHGEIDEGILAIIQNNIRCPARNGGGPAGADRGGQYRRPATARPLHQARGGRGRGGGRGDPELHRAPGARRDPAAAGGRVHGRRLHGRRRHRRRALRGAGQGDAWRWPRVVRSPPAPRRSAAGRSMRPTR